MPACRPQPMIDEMIKVITGESDRYRTVYPKSMEDEVRQWQAAECDKTV